ncbi:hypothetical protein HN587_04620 [Candidatus Woesearchaeota archaeon]|jgi:hypothetical protein|nr:hypothetical protein [Candidatus Woesearchaeota archaeon]
MVVPNISNQCPVAGSNINPASAVNAASNKTNLRVVTQNTPAVNRSNLPADFKLAAKELDDLFVEFSDTFELYGRFRKRFAHTLMGRELEHLETLLADSGKSLRVSEFFFHTFLPHLDEYCKWLTTNFHDSELATKLTKLMKKFVAKKLIPPQQDVGFFTSVKNNLASGEVFHLDVVHFVSYFEQFVDYVEKHFPKSKLEKKLAQSDKIVFLGKLFEEVKALEHFKDLLTNKKSTFVTVLFAVKKILASVNSKPLAQLLQDFSKKDGQKIIDYLVAFGIDENVPDYWAQLNLKDSPSTIIAKAIVSYLSKFDNNYNDNNMIAILSDIVLAHLIENTAQILESRYKDKAYATIFRTQFSKRNPVELLNSLISNLKSGDRLSKVEHEAVAQVKVIVKLYFEELKKKSQKVQVAFIESISDRAHKLSKGLSHELNSLKKIQTDESELYRNFAIAKSVIMHYHSLAVVAQQEKSKREDFIGSVATSNFKGADPERVVELFTAANDNSGFIVTLDKRIKSNVSKRDAKIKQLLNDIHNLKQKIAFYRKLKDEQIRVKLGEPPLEKHYLRLPFGLSRIFSAKDIATKKHAKSANVVSRSSDKSQNSSSDSNSKPELSLVQNQKAA